MSRKLISVAASTLLAGGTLLGVTAISRPAPQPLPARIDKLPVTELPAIIVRPDPPLHTTRATKQRPLPRRAAPAMLDGLPVVNLPGITVRPPRKRRRTATTPAMIDGLPVTNLPGVTMHPSLPTRHFATTRKAPANGPSA